MKLRRRLRPDYTPPTFAEFEEIVGRDDTSFTNFKLYDSMRLAMSCRVYDRTEAFKRLRSIADSKRDQEAFMERMRWRGAPSESSSPAPEDSAPRKI